VSAQGTAATFLLVVGGILVVFGAGRDVVDFEIVLWLVPPVFIVLVEAAHGTLFDRALRTAIRILPRRFSFVLGRSIRAEIPVAHGRRRAAAATFGARCPAAGPWCEAAAAAGSRARARAVPTRSWSASWTLLTRTSFADGKRASLERLLIETTDRRFRNRAVCIIDEREAARAPRFAIDWENDLTGFTDARQVLSQLCL
jgi:hypothetical protein